MTTSIKSPENRMPKAPVIDISDYKATKNYQEMMGRTVKSDDIVDTMRIAINESLSVFSKKQQKQLAIGALAITAFMPVMDVTYKTIGNVMSNFGKSKPVYTENQLASMDMIPVTRNAATLRTSDQIVPEALPSLYKGDSRDIEVASEVEHFVENTELAHNNPSVAYVPDVKEFEKQR